MMMYCMLCMLNGAVNWYAFNLQTIQKAPSCRLSLTTRAARLRWEMLNLLTRCGQRDSAVIRPWEFLNTAHSRGHLGDVCWKRGECCLFSALTLNSMQDSSHSVNAHLCHLELWNSYICELSNSKIVYIFIIFTMNSICMSVIISPFFSLFPPPSMHSLWRP